MRGKWGWGMGGEKRNGGGQRCGKKREVGNGGKIEGRRPKGIGGRKEKERKKIKKEKHHEVESGGFWTWESTGDR